MSPQRIIFIDAELLEDCLRASQIDPDRTCFIGKRDADLELARKLEPDVVLMDVRMPRMTGYEACKIMKATPDLRDIPVVFLSAKGQESEIQQGLDAGAEEYLLKPFAPDQLTNRVKAILGKFGK